MHLRLKQMTIAFLISINSSLPLALILSEIPSAFAASTKNLEDKKAQADVLEQEALKKYLKSKFPETLQIYKKLLVIYREIGDKQREGKNLNKIANIYIKENEHYKALGTLHQAIKIHKQVGNRGEEAESFILKGIAHRYLREKNLALVSFKAALATSREIGNSSTEVKSLLRMADIYSNQEKYSLTLESYEQVLAIYKKFNNLTAAISLLPKMVRLYKQQGNSFRALELAQEAFDIAKGTKSFNKEIAEAIINITQIYFNYQEYKKVIVYVQENLQIANNFHNHVFQLQALNLLSKAYNVIGNYDKAIQYAHRALVIQQFLSKRDKRLFVTEFIHEELASVLFTLASAYASKGDYQKANEYAKIGKSKSPKSANGYFGPLPTSYAVREIVSKSISDIYNPLGKPQGIIHNIGPYLFGQYVSKAFNLAIIASNYISLGNYQQAIHYSNQSLPLARANQDFYAEVLALVSSASAYSSLGKYKKAIKQFKQGIALMPAVDEYEIKPLAWSLLASIYASRKEYKNALYFARKGLAIAQEYVNYSHGDLVLPLFVVSGIYFELGEYEKAINLAKRN